MPVPVPRRPIRYLLNNGTFECTLTFEEIAYFLHETDLEQLQYILANDLLGSEAINYLKLLVDFFEVLGA